MSEIPDPFGATTVEDDPFATADDVKGGTFTPTPYLEALEGKLVVMVPRKFVDDAPIPKEWQVAGGPTVRDRYTVDLVVLGAGAFTFPYMAKVEGQEEREEKSHTVDLPALFTNVWMVQASIIGQLRKVDGTSRPLLRGIVRRGPQAADRRNGKTFADVEAAFAAWRRNPKPNQTPKFSWQIDVDGVTAEQAAAALTWYRNAVQNGFTL